MGEISPDELNQIRSKNVKLASAHGLPEIDEKFRWKVFSSTVISIENVNFERFI